MTSPTKETYGQLDKAYTHFNKTLFGNHLPECIIVLARKRNARGYFWGDTWRRAGGKQKADEIALNPDTLSKRTLEQVLSTLVHEMCHLDQHHNGKPSRTGYHNKEWAGYMDAVGLTPSDTGLAGGKRTGQRVTHYAEANGAFERSCGDLIKSGFVIPWLATTVEGGAKAKAKAKCVAKVKYTCPNCDLNVWGKSGLAIGCQDCEVALEAS